MTSSPSPSGNLELQGGGSMERAQSRAVTDRERIMKARASVSPESTTVVVLVTSVDLDSGKTSDSRVSDYPELKGGEDEIGIVSASKGSTKRSHHYLAILISWFLGNELLFLWNAILNSGDYFYSKFPDYHPSRVFPLLYVLVALVLSCGFLVSAQDQGSIRWRVLNGFWVFCAAAIFIIFVIAGEGALHWLGTRFAFIAISTLVVLSGIGEGICGGGLLGEFSFMDPVYLQAFNAGLSASGIATSGLRLITKCIFGDTLRGLRNGCLTFFAMTALVQLAGIFAYAIVFPRLEGVRSYRLQAVAQGSSFVDASIDDSAPGNDAGGKVVSEKKDRERSSYMDLGYENWDYALDTLVLYAVTFSIIPGFLYENTGSHSLGSWYPLVLLAIFNATDFLSRIFRIEKLFMRSRRALGVSCCGLVLFFIPGFYFGARYGGTALMMVLCGLLGAYNGYLTVCIFDNAPVGFKAPEQIKIGGVLYISTLIGITIGLAANWFWLIH